MPFGFKMQRMQTVNPDLVQMQQVVIFFGTIITILLTVIGFFLRAALVDLKGNIKENSRDIQQHETRITVLEKTTVEI